MYLGNSSWPPIGKLVSVSFRVRVVRASGRGEAVWACERGGFVNAGGLHSNISSSSVSGRGCLFGVFFMLCSWVLTFFGTDCCYAHGFFDFFLFLMVCSWVFWCFCTPCSFLLLCSWVFWSFFIFDGMLMGFLRLFAHSRWSQQIASTVDLSR